MKFIDLHSFPSLNYLAARRESPAKDCATKLVSQLGKLPSKPATDADNLFARLTDYAPGPSVSGCVCTGNAPEYVVIPQVADTQGELVFHTSRQRQERSEPRLANELSCPLERLDSSNLFLLPGRMVARERRGEVWRTSATGQLLAT